MTAHPAPAFPALARRNVLALLGATSLLPFRAAWAQTSGTAPATSDPAAAKALSDLLEASEAAQNRLDPMASVRRGQIPAGPAFVDPLSDSYATALVRDKESEFRQLQAIDRARLNPVDRIAWDVFRYRTEQTLAFFHDGLFKVSRLAPLNPSFGLQVEFPDFVAGAGAQAKTVPEFEFGVRRLEGFAGFLNSTVERLKQGQAAGYVQSRIIVENVLKQVDAMLAIPVEDSPFYRVVKTIPPEVATAIGEAEVTRLRAAYRAAIENAVLPGYRLWKTFLTETYLPAATEVPGRLAMKDGRALYAAELMRHTTTRTPAAEIHKTGIAEVARIRADMEAVKKKIGFAGTLRQFFDYVRDDPKFYYTTQEQLLGRFREIEAQIWPNIPKLFHDKPKAPFEVRPLPVLGDQRGTGYYRAGPPDASGPGILFFNMSMLNTRPIPTLETLTLHEGIPGHHFQISLVQERTELPPILRFGKSTAYSEGWGLYAESLGRELGMFQDPYQWFGHLDMEMLRAVRLVVDTGLHNDGWSREKAIQYMLENTSMAPRDVAVEVDRYIAAPGQACAYKIGERKILELRGRAQRALGKRFDIRDFHAQILNTGALPMDVLDAKISAWLKEPRKA